MDEALLGQGEGQRIVRPEAAAGVEHRNFWSVAFSPQKEKRRWRWSSEPEGAGLQKVI